MTISGAALAMFVVWGTASLAQAGGRSAGDWVHLLIALGIGVTYLYLGNRLLLARFYVLAALSGLWGALSSMAAEGALAAAVYFGLLGLSVLASGLYHLVAHLRGRRSR